MKDTEFVKKYVHARGGVEALSEDEKKALAEMLRESGEGEG